MAVQTFYFDTLDSTNAYARREFDALPDGALVVAGSQTAGRGRLGRQWLSEPGLGIYASLVMKQCPDAFAATMALSLGALAMLRRAAEGVDFWIKWPNDIYVGSRKLAGVLCESRLGPGNRFEGIIAGIGINVNHPAEVLSSIDLPATSLKIEKKSFFCVKKLTSALESELNRCYIAMIMDLSETRNAWRAANRIIGRDIELTGGKGPESGRVIDIDDDGALIFQPCGEAARKVYSGDVRIARESLSQFL